MVKINPSKTYRVTTYFSGDPNRQSMSGQEILQLLTQQGKLALILHATTDAKGNVFAKGGQLLFHESKSD